MVVNDSVTPPLVGRPWELAQLEEELERARAGRFGTGLVVADPGVGTTRLAGEILASHGQECICLSARAHPLGDTTSFGLWAEAFEGHLRSREPAEVVRLCGGLLDDLAGLLRSAAAAGGGIPEREPSRVQLIEGLAVLLTNLARSGPVLILLRAAGARAVHRLNAPPLNFHPMSTMRMGAHPADSVCDENGGARAVRRLYIADNSVLANALGGSNPTLTTQALATRTAEKIFALEFGGDPWVGREAPLSSVDPAVTEAVLGAGVSW